MGRAFVDLGWTPATFWASTPHELFAAFDFQHERAEAEAEALEEAKRRG